MNQTRRLSFYACLMLLLLVFWPAPALAGLKVQSILPQGKVQRLTQIVVRFSKPMHPVGDMSQPAETSPVRLDPRPAGSFRWLGPSTLAFLLDKPITGAARLSITVPKGVKALDGSTLAKTVRAAVIGPAIEAYRLIPKPGSTLGPRPRIQIYINQPVDLDSLSRRTWFVVKGRRIKARVRHVPLPGWVQEGGAQARIYEAEPVEDLPGGAKAVLKIAAGVAPGRGLLASGRDFIFHYKTYQGLRLVKWSMPPGFGGGLDPNAPLLLEWNNPVDPRLLAEHIRISPPLKLNLERMGSQPTRWFYLEPGFKPRGSYLLEVAAGLKDAYGQALAQGAAVSLKMGDLHPVLSLMGGKGVLESLPGEKAAYPLKVRNLDSVLAGLRYLKPDEAVPALVAEQERPWDQKPRLPSLSEGWQAAQKIHLRLPPNLSSIHPLNLKELMGQSPMGGLVLVDVRAVWPDSKARKKTHIRRAFVQVTDLGLSLKLGEDSGLAWVSKLSTGQPLGGVKLELRDRENKVVWKGESDWQGKALLPGLAKLKPAPNKARPWRDPQVYLLARSGRDMALLPSGWADDFYGAMPSSGPVRRPSAKAGLLAHAVTQLPLYQPGQKVRFVVYLRRQTSQGLALPARGKVKLEVRDPYGKVLRSLTGTPNEFGSLAGSVSLGASARLGEYSLAAVCNGVEARAGGFRVASFRPPDFRVRLTSPQEQVGKVSQGGAAIQAEYLFGAPVAGGKAKVEVEQRQAFFAPKGLEGYAVGFIPAPGDEPRLTRHLATLRTGLDAQGAGRVTLPPAQPEAGLPVRVSLEARVADPSQRWSGAGASYIAHPSSVYLGLKAPVLARAEEPVKLEVMARGFDNLPLKNQAVELVAYREYWETVRERGPGGFWRYQGKARRKEVWRTSLVLGSGPAFARFKPPEPGAYVLAAAAADPAGRINKSACYMYATGRGAAGWQRFDDHRLELIAPPGEYKPGQSVRILMKNPFAKATALVSLERQGVSRVMVREVSGPTPEIDIPLRPEDAPNVFVGVLLVRGRAGKPKAGAPDLGKPQVRLGYAMVKVADPSAGLVVKVEPEKAKLRPGGKVNALVSVNTRKGEPRRAEVTLLAVDERVLTAAGGRDNYDPDQTFGREQALAVLSCDSRTQVVGQRRQGQKGDDAAGGGGQGPSLRKKFHPAVFWLAQARTDESGRLKASFVLPDSLTAYRLVAVAADPERGFGLGRADITASQPLQLLSALPRFAVKGDEFQARVLVQNLSAKPGKATVEAKAGGMELTGEAQKELMLEPGRMKAVGFRVKAAQTGPGSVTVKAAMGPERDAARFTLPVLPAAALVSGAASGGLRPGAGRAAARTLIKLPQDAEKGRGGLTLILSPSLAGALRPAAGALLEYPWDCLEQRLGKAAARAVKVRMGKALGLSDMRRERSLAAAALASAADFQTPSGGFTFWPGMGRPDAFLTAYVLTAAQQIGKAGPSLGGQVKKQALEYLARYLRRRPAPKAWDLPARVTEAFIISTLARHGAPVRPFFASAMGRSKGLSAFGLACLLDAAYARGLTQARQELMARLESQAVVTPRHLHFRDVDPGGIKAVMGSALRGNAALLWVLSRAAPSYGKLDALASWVALRLSGERAISTQDAVFGLWGLAAYLETGGTGGPMDISASLGGREIFSHTFAGPLDPPVTVQVMRSLLEPGKAMPLVVKAKGMGRPLWASRLSYAPKSQGQGPVNSGFSVSRTWMPGQGGSREPVMGQEVESLITLVVPETRHHVLVYDPYPAGLEPSQAAGGAPSGGGRGPWSWRELRKDGLLLYAERLEPGVYSFRYRLRAVAPGRFAARPVRAEEMYSPEVFGRGASGVLNIKQGRAFEPGPETAKP